MEQHLDKVLSDKVAQPETVGCLIANRQGLCLGAKGKINTDVSGLAVGIAEHACKLEPNSDPPVVILHSGDKRCVIQKDGEITAVIYKQSSR